MANYGAELIIDLHNCNSKQFTREIIESYFIILCKLIDMEREDLHWWDDLDTEESEKQTEIHLIGTSAIQFITTSNITIHTLDRLNKCFINLFSCKKFDEQLVLNFTKHWFLGEIVNWKVIKRL